MVEILAELGISGAELQRLAAENIVCLPDRLPHLTRLT
jgi:hypothetical protein